MRTWLDRPPIRTFLRFQAPSPDFLPNSYNGFLAKLNPAGRAMVWAAYFEAPQSIAVDAGGNVWAVGGGNNTAFTLPNLNGWTTGLEFLAEMNVRDRR